MGSRRLIFSDLFIYIFEEKKPFSLNVRVITQIQSWVKTEGVCLITRNRHVILGHWQVIIVKFNLSPVIERYSHHTDINTFTRAH